MLSYGSHLTYLFERKQGSSHARNAAISRTQGDLIGFIDDDETIVPEWYQVVFNAFVDNPDVDFAGGPCLPDWQGIRPPEWLPVEYSAVIGVKDGGASEAVFGRDAEAGSLMSGNAVVHRRCVERIGLFNPSLGRIAKGLLSSEDEDFFERLLNAGFKGVYLPEMAIRHLMQESRCTKRYHRRWCFWLGVSDGFRRRNQNLPGPLWAGLPRWRYRRAFAGILSAACGALRRDKLGEAFAGELAAWNLVGLLYGRYFWESQEPLSKLPASFSKSNPLEGYSSSNKPAG